MPDPSEHPPLVHRRLDRLAAISWRLIVIGIVVLALLWLLRQARVVVFPVVVALFVVRALAPLNGWLRRHRWRAGLAASASIATAMVVVGGLLAIVIPSFASELDSIGPTLTKALDDVEDWLVDEGPFDISRASIDRLRERAGEEVDAALRSSDGDLTDRATLVAEAIAGLLLAGILTFFMLRDGTRFADWVCRRARPDAQPRVRRALDAAWSALGGYLRGATLLGAVEGAAIGLTLALAGGGLVAPVVLITFMGAYVPVAGALVTGVVAVLVALVTGGTGAAVAVGIVALLVQQFDNDLLAPVVYGKALHLHPVVVLLSVAGGGALFGLAGTLLAVPVVAVAVNASRAYDRAALELRTT